MKHLTIKGEMSMCLFVRYILQRLRTDLHQTWKEGRGWTRKTPRGTRFHGNQFVAMATKKMVFLWQDQDCGWV